MALKIPHLYTGADGQSHWDEIEIDYNPVAAWGNPPDFGFTNYQTATGIRFRFAPPGADTGWTNAPQRQYVITLTGEVEYEIGDGTKRRFGPGAIYLVEDTTGQGHVSRGVGDAPRLCAYVPVPKG
jgi:hypothetical protein